MGGAKESQTELERKKETEEGKRDRGRQKDKRVRGKAEARTEWRGGRNKGKVEGKVGR